MANFPVSVTGSYIGIDPGTTGVIAVINGGDSNLGIAPNVTLFDIPLEDTDRKRPDLPNLCSLAHALFATLGGGVVMVEDIWIAAGDNPSSAAKVLRIAASCEAAFCAAGFDVRVVPPQTWKAAFGIAGAGLIEADRGKRRKILKDRARAKVVELFPAHAGLFERVKDADRAEATLIAKYAQLKA
jgi:hypothetical protein